jgi:hypothetical protein
MRSRTSLRAALLCSSKPDIGYATRGDLTVSRVKRTLVAVIAASLLMLGMTAAPAFAFIHEFIPAGACAVSDQAGDNETAEAHLPRVPIQIPPAPDTCPAPQK